MQFGLSDTAFWILYALYSSAAPPQVRMCAEWCLPKQTLNSAVRSMGAGTAGADPRPPRQACQNLNLTESGALARKKTIARGLSGRRRQPYAAWGLERMEQTLPSGRDTCRNYGKNLHS